MRTSRRGVALIKHFEEFSSVPYLCPGNVRTIGWGHTKGVTKDTKAITLAEGEILLGCDLIEFEDAVTDLVVVPLEQHQFDALVSFAFNVGIGAFGKSTLLKMINAGNTASAANQFGRWTKSRGRVLGGLVKRRAAERAMFEGLV